MKAHTVRGGGGLRLHVREWGKTDGPPILFIHGWSQNHLCWAKQYESALADEFRLVAYDLRGHGMSEAPLEPEHYTDGKLWADDVAAIIDELRLDRPVLVGWSYGASSSATTSARYGQDEFAAINFVEAAVKLGEAAFGTLIGPGFLDHFVGRHRGRPADQHRSHALLRPGVPRRSRAGRRPRDGGLLEHRRAGASPRQPRGPRDRLRRRAARPRGAAARHAGPRRHGRATGDGRARSRHLPDRRGVLVRGRRSRAAPGGADRFNRELAELTRRVEPLSPTETTFPRRFTMTSKHTTNHNPILAIPLFMALVLVLAFLAFSPAVGASPAERSGNFPHIIDLPNGFLPEGIEQRAGHVVLRRIPAGRHDLAGRFSNRVGRGVRGRRARERRRRHRVRGASTTGSGSQAAGRSSSAAAICACTTRRAGRCSRRISRQE